MAGPGMQNFEPQNKPLHHVLPATYLAHFSKSPKVPRRDSLIAVGNRESRRTFLATAGSVGAVRGLYTLRNDDHDREQIERSWHGYEGHLADAVDELIAGSVDAITWAQILVPFVAALLVRGPDFDRRFADRLRPVLHLVDVDNTNRARHFELQRLLAPVLTARWVVMAAQGSESLLTNDFGFAAFRGPDGRIGMAVPLSRRHVLGVLPQFARAIVQARDGRWWPNIDYVNLTQDNHHDLNAAIVSSARKLVFGDDESVVRKYLAAVKPTVHVALEPFRLGFISGAAAVPHEFTWHRLVGILSKPADSLDVFTFDLDFSAIASAPWKPHIILPVNLPVFPASLARFGDAIHACLYYARPVAGKREWEIYLPAGWPTQAAQAL